MALQSNNSSLPSNQRYNGIENRNFLSPVGFQFAISKMKGVEFFCQSATIPAINSDPVDIGSVVNRFYMPGDELTYAPLFVRFLVDENMKNYYQVHDWMRKIATPYSQREFTYDRKKQPSQFKRDTESDLEYENNDWKSDCSLTILSSNYRPVAEFVFKDCFPISLTPLNFDAASTDVNYFTAEVQLRYDYFDYLIGDAAYITDSSMKPTYRKSQEGVDLY